MKKLGVALGVGALIVGVAFVFMPRKSVHLDSSQPRRAAVVVVEPPAVSQRTGPPITPRVMDPPAVAARTDLPMRSIWIEPPAVSAFTLPSTS